MSTAVARAQFLSTTQTGVRGIVGAGVVGGFGVAVAMWLVWFVGHLPSVRLEMPVAAAVLLVVLALGSAAAGRLAPRGAGALVGLGAGLVSALINLMLLGSKIVEQPAIDPATGGEGVGVVRPGAAIAVAGFVGLSALIGVVSGALGHRFRCDRVHALATPAHRMASMAVVACCATAPLLFIGGLVTSTESGMAVPDWPTSFGANMFLYPIGLMAHPRIYLEHAHRLFGTLVGVATIAAFVYALVAAPTARLKWAGLGLVVLVSVQGVLGGVRVTENNLFYALFHGVTAQIFFALLVAFAACVSPLHTLGSPSAQTRAAARGGRVVGAIFLGCLFLQLVLGAAYRHQGHVHALYTHAAFAIVAVIVGVVAAFRVGRASPEEREGRVLRRVGAWVIGVLAAQFMLGWLAFAVVMTAPDRGGVPTHDQMDSVPPVPMFEALATTAHQANGALLLAVATLLLVWALRLGRGGAGEGSAETGAPA